MKETTSQTDAAPASHDEIARRAQEIWQNYGAPQGRDEEIWLEAERQLQSQHTPSQSPVKEKTSATVPQSTTGAAAAESRKIPSKEAELMETKSSTIPSRPKIRSAKGR